MNRPLDKASLLDGLTTRLFGRKLFVFAEIDSTNACARALADIGNPIGTVVIADHQTAGRGRLGRRWEAEPRTNVLLSVLLGSGAEFPIWRWTYLLSEATVRAVQQSTGLSVETKWPNDLLIDGKKCCGILLETAGTVDKPFCLGGIGLNVNQSRFAGDLEDRATSLRLATGVEHDRKQIFQALMDSIEDLYDRASQDGGRSMLESWTQRCITFGRPVIVRGAGMNLEGTAVGLSDDGGLVVRHGARSTTVYAGDVTISDPTS
ncbi:MAG: biotin--[acetyl-CoA-carboxylase] ligase [Bacteroidetes bacterium]|nr:biotin--[acetyl-CoA-carboxylase] ligase [Bacteroidota bacterium]